MLIHTEKVIDPGFTRVRIPNQILPGLLLALLMSAILTVLPILAGFKDMVGDTHYKNAWSLPTNSSIAFWEWNCFEAPGRVEVWYFVNILDQLQFQVYPRYMNLNPIYRNFV